MTSSERRRQRYRSDEAYRLSRINKARAYRGSRPITSVRDCYTIGVDRGPRQRDELGRFIPDGAHDASA